MQLKVVQMLHVDWLLLSWPPHCPEKGTLSLISSFPYTSGGYCLCLAEGSAHDFLGLDQNVGVNLGVLFEANGAVPV